MTCNPCCCCSYKDSAVTIGIWTLFYSVLTLVVFGWQMAVLNNCRQVTMAQANLQCQYDCPCVGATTSRTTALIEAAICQPTNRQISYLVFSFAQLGIMGWQMADIKYQKDRAANTILPNYNEYGKYDIPSYYESYWQSPEERYYIGLFIIQVLCIISAFFLLFASAALIWGIHTWSRYLVWPWFPCIISSILTSLAYCIMWWSGDVRGYWLALTILEIIGVVINVYCTIVVMMYYRNIDIVTDVVENKADLRINRKPRKREDYSSGRRDRYHHYDDRMMPLSPGYSPFPRQPYPPQVYPSPYSPTGVPQTPLQLPPTYTPYPADPNEVLDYNKEPKRHDSSDEDPVRSWVKHQQKLASERGVGEANSEPISPTREEKAAFPIQHSRSVPSLYDGTLVSHENCRHDRHDRHRRSSSRHRRSSSRHRDRRDDDYDSDSRDRRRHHREGSRRRYRDASRYSDSEYTETTVHRHRDDRRRDREDRHRHRDDRERSSSRHRHRDKERREKDRRRHRDSDDETERRPRRRDDKKSSKYDDITAVEKTEKIPLDQNGIGGFQIPQHQIIIPPTSTIERGLDGKPLPQQFEINQKITINYDEQGQQLEGERPARPRHMPTQITSNV